MADKKKKEEEVEAVEEQPVVNEATEPKAEVRIETTPAPVAEAPDTTTQKQMHEDPSKLDQSGDTSQESSGGGSAPKRGKKSDS